MHTKFCKTDTLLLRYLRSPRYTPGPALEDPRFSYLYIPPTDRSPCNKQENRAASSLAMDRSFSTGLHSAIENTLVQPCSTPLDDITNKTLIQFHSNFKSCCHQLLAQDPAPIQHRFQMKHGHFPFGSEADKGAVVGIFSAIGKIPVEGVAEQAKTGCAAIVVGQGCFERVNVRSIRGFGDLSNGRFVNPSQPLGLSDSLLVGIHGCPSARGDIALLVCPGNRRVFRLRSFAEELFGKKSFAAFGSDGMSKLPIVWLAVDEP